MGAVENPAEPVLPLRALQIQVGPDEVREVAAHQDVRPCQQAARQDPLVSQRRPEHARHPEAGVEQVHLAERARLHRGSRGALARRRPVVRHEGGRRPRVARQEAAPQHPDAFAVIGQRGYQPRRRRPPGEHPHAAAEPLAPRGREIPGEAQARREVHRLPRHPVGAAAEDRVHLWVVGRVAVEVEQLGPEPGGDRQPAAQAPLLPQIRGVLPAPERRAGTAEVPAQLEPVRGASLEVLEAREGPGPVPVLHPSPKDPEALHLEPRDEHVPGPPGNADAVPDLDRARPPVASVGTLGAARGERHRLSARARHHYPHQRLPHGGVLFGVIRAEGHEQLLLPAPGTRDVGLDPEHREAEPPIAGELVARERKGVGGGAGELFFPAVRVGDEPGGPGVPARHRRVHPGEQVEQRRAVLDSLT